MSGGLDVEDLNALPPDREGTEILLSSLNYRIRTGEFVVRAKSTLNKPDFGQSLGWEDFIGAS